MAEEKHLPSIEQLRESQRKGREDEGLNETDCLELNAVQGHKADIREYPGADAACKAIHEGMMDNEDANVDLLDRTAKKDWPDTVCLDD